MFGLIEHERYHPPGEKSKRMGPVKNIATRALTSLSLLRSDKKQENIFSPIQEFRQQEKVVSSVLFEKLIAISKNYIA